MQGGRVRHFAHGPAQRINFPHDLPLGNPADRRITGHLRHRIQTLGKQERFGPGFGGNQGGLAPGVPAPYHYYIILRITNKHLFPHAKSGENNV